MRVIQFQAENYKKLRAVSITPDGNVVQLTGKNKQGKSSVLDAIAAAMRGSVAIQEVPIRDGEKQSKIVLGLGDKEVEVVVTRKFTMRDNGEWTTSLTVESPAGAVFKSPQALLDGLYGALAFDPLAFVRMDRKGQLDAMKRLVPGVNFAKIEADNKADYDKRTDLNRDAKNLRAQVAGLDVDVKGERPVRVDSKDIEAELQAANTHNADIQARKKNREDAPGVIEQHRKDADNERVELAKVNAKILALQKEAETLEANAQVCDKDAADLELRLSQAPPLPDLIDIATVSAKFTTANATNNAVLAWEKMDTLVKQAEALEAQANDLTFAIDTRLAEKDKAIREAKLPVEGLGITEQGVTLNKLPFEQASSSEQIRTSVGVAMALNPKLRVIRVKDGSLLDSESLALLSEMAAEKDYQVWIERVDSSEDAVGFVLEDGAIKGAEPEAPPVAPEAAQAELPTTVPAAPSAKKPKPL